MSTFRMHVAFAVFSGLRGFLYEPKGTTRIHYKISNVLKLGKNPISYNQTLQRLMRNVWNFLKTSSIHTSIQSQHIPIPLQTWKKHANDGHHGQSAICKPLLKASWSSPQGRRKSRPWSHSRQGCQSCSHRSHRWTQQSQSRQRSEPIQQLAPWKLLQVRWGCLRTSGLRMETRSLALAA